MMSMTDVKVTFLEYLSDLGTAGAIKASLSVIGGCFAWLIGGCDDLVTYLFVLMVVDFVCGFVKAIQCNCLSSAKFRAGLVKFILYFVTIFVAVMADKSVNPQLSFLENVGVTVTINFRNFVILYLTIHEAISVLTHISFFGDRIGCNPVPKAILHKLNGYRDYMCQSNVCVETKTTITSTKTSMKEDRDGEKSDGKSCECPEGKIEDDKC
jgi:toxin secretion/phage lysis holin